MPILHGYNLVNLEEMISVIGEEETRNIISSFSCPKNKEVETFLLRKAIGFSNQRFAATHLIFLSYLEKPVLAGYFTVASRAAIFDLGSIKSGTLRKRISKFAIFDPETKNSSVQVTLIGQLGKNFTNDYNHLITGDELLGICLNKIRDIQLAVGGALILVECEDDPNLHKFYDRNGFVTIGKRDLDGDETDIRGTYLVQKIHYLPSAIPDNRESLVPFFKRSH